MIDGNEIRSIVHTWTIDEAKYLKIGIKATTNLKTLLLKNGILAEISYRTKELHSIIKKIDKHRKDGKKCEYCTLKDRLGLRIICIFESELQTIDAIIKNAFKVNSIEYKKKNLKFNELGYQSNHYDVFLNEDDAITFEDTTDSSNYIFEIQVRTLNQHAWSDAAHQLSYKQDTVLPDEMQHKLYRLLTLYELADQEIENIHKYLHEQHSSNPAFDIVQKLEKYFYRYAQIDYDRDITKYYTNKLSAIFESTEIEDINNNIESFIQSNESKILSIFAENRCRFHEVVNITQPEIFIIWYALEKFEYSLINKWNDHFDHQELTLITNIWGPEID